MKFLRTLIGCVGLVAPVMALCLLPASLAWGQAVSGSQISGIVKDASGGVLPGVTVTATNTDTGIERTVYTTGEGAFNLPSLPVGPYKLTASLTGFTTYVQSGIVLQVGSNPTINVTLSVGGVGEEVNVVAAATMVDTRGTSVGQLIEEKQIVNLPLNGRQPTQLILLSGAAVVTTAGALVGDRRQYPSSVSISVAGGTGNGTAYLVDGGYNNDPLANVSQPFPFPDALQEFKVENGVRPARYGILPGATVNAVTKSGANNYRGALFEFYRDHRFNAIKPFTTSDDGLNRNQWGGTVGGPIARNKAFFFGGVQFTRLRVNPTDTTSFVPSAKMRAGDFTDVASAACNAGNALTLPAPFVNNRVDPALFNPVAVNLMKYLPVSDDPCGRIAFKVPDNSNEQLGVGRVDWQMTTSRKLFVRYFIANYDRAPLYDGTNVLMSTGNGLGLDNRVQTGVMAHDWAVRSNLFSSTRLSFAKSRILRLQGDSLFTWKDLGSKMTPMATDPGMEFGVATITNGYPQTAFPGRFNSMTWQLSQDFDWTKGAHQLAFGGMWIRPKLDAYGPFQANGWFTFNGSRVGGGRVGYADLLLGLPSQFREGGIQDIQQHMNYLAAYVQDTWRISDRLTLNAGLRWEPYHSAVDEAGYASHFEMDNFFANIRSTVYTKAPVGLMYPGDNGYPGTSYNRSNKNQFAPRLGMVWDPTGDGKQTIRAAGGIFYEMPKMWQYGRAPLNPPFGNTLVVNNPASFTDPWATYAGGDPFPIQKPVSSTVT
ncbi:MAG: TonB-dependent receptor [Acidobacteria bacterium]|nr:TonB-dependent receptor [Acidobacteriota bacterium]